MHKAFLELKPDLEKETIITSLQLYSFSSFEALGFALHEFEKKIKIELNLKQLICKLRCRYL